MRVVWFVKLYDYAKLFRSHGMTREASVQLQEQYERSRPDLNPLFTFAVPGYNMRNQELNAVLGLEQLKRLNYNCDKRRDNFKSWVDSLNSNKFMKLTNYKKKTWSKMIAELIEENYEDI